MTDVAADQAAPAPVAGQHRPIPIRHVAAVVIGNGLEFYDFLTYGYFAVYIGRAFFPSEDPTTSLLASLATFGAGFLTRPIGAIVLGTMGDRIGRKPAMMISFSMMGAAIVGLALTPTYAQIGIAAPILVILFRMTQGFALGGEVGPTTAYMLEAAPPHRRGLYASMQYTTQDAAVLVAGIVGTILASNLTDQQLQDWGWRFAMLLGAAIVPFGIIIRRALPETLHTADDAVLAPDATAGDATVKRPLRPHLRVIVLGLLMLLAGTIGAYSLSYMTTYALTALKMQANVAFGIIIVNGLFAVMFEPVSGWLSDKFGRKPVMIVPGVVLLLSIFPAFWIIAQFRTIETFYAAVAWLVVLQALSATPVIVTLTESLPKRIRSGAVAMVYAFAISIFGGTTQFTITWLISASGDPLAPAYYWTAASLLGLIAMTLVKESAPVKLARRA